MEMVFPPMFRGKTTITGRQRGAKFEKDNDLLELF